MTAVVPVYFDYASSLCYIAAIVGRQLEAELDVTLDWRPVEIAAQYPGLKKGGSIGGDTRAKIERVSAETGVPVVIPRRWLDSRAALEGALFARDRGRFREYHQQVFEAGFVAGKDIGDRRVLSETAAAAGLPMGDFMMAIATRAKSADLARCMIEAAALGVVGYPTFFLGEFPLTGIQPLVTMRLLFQRYLRQRARRPIH